MSITMSSARDQEGIDAPRPTFTDDEERLRHFAEELDALRRRTLDKVGAEDMERVRRLDRISRSLGVLGRVLIHVSPEPLSFAAGVCSLWIHRQIQAMEIGHTALHGAYDGLEGAETFAARTFRWETSIDEQAWRHAHNAKHHGFTNVAGKDPDLHFGPVRLTEQTPHRTEHLFQLPFTLGVVLPNFGILMSWHVTGLDDYYFGDGPPGALGPNGKDNVREAWKRAFRKYGPYCFWNYVFFPALAGPMFWKVMLGNYLAELMRDIFSGAVIYCNHVGEDVKSFANGKRPEGRGAWYAMQVEAANNFKAGRALSVLCGGLDLHIEHHLFPTLPPERLREIAPEVRGICERHGVAYKIDTWGRTLRKAFSQVLRLARPGAKEAPADADFTSAEGT